MASSTTTKYTKSVVIKPGESFTIPPNSTVTAISGDVTSDCELPAPEAYECYAFYYSISDAGGAGSALEDDDIKATAIEVGGVTYALDRDNLQNEGLLLEAIKDVVPEGLLQMIDATTPFSTADRQDLKIRFRTFTSLASTIRLKFEGGGYPNLYISPVKETDCP